MSKSLKYLVLSDIHLGHHNTTTLEIIQHLDAYFNNYTCESQFCDLDILFIAGDLFDQLLDLSDPNFHEMMLWSSRLLSFCHRNKIKLRILEGTPSHDWKQSKLIATLREAIKNKVDLKNLDLKYVDTLSIEYIQEYDLNVLYVPDEWATTAEDCLEQVKVLLREKNLSQVDIAIMHGAFKYQIPVIQSPAFHEESDYLRIVKHFISIGHIHVYSKYDRIIAQGSFDRIAHGEEGPKGGVLIVRDEQGEWSHFFIENKLAKKYVTIEIKTKDLEKATKQIERVLTPLPKESYVRILADKANPVFAGFDSIKKKYLQYNFTKKARKEDLDIDKPTSIKIDTQYSAIELNASNIAELIRKEITSIYTLNERENTILSDILTETMDAV